MILVTGGLGYIGSHCVLNLLERGHSVVIFDNLSTGHIETFDVLKKIGKVEFFKGDLLNKKDLNKLFSLNDITCVFHFAGLSQVLESMKNPQKYYENNVLGTLNLLEEMIKNDVKKIIFSSSASVYGEPKYVPIDENHPLNPINEYGKTKLSIENILDEYDLKHGLKSARLRYFNVIGADIKARVGEWHDKETHLIPNILKSANEKNREIQIFGDDYDTKDGTCIRDYVNIEDLVEAHIKAFEYLNNCGKTDSFNIGTNEEYSVKEIFEICEKITNKKISFNIVSRREGDCAKLLADNSKARMILNWRPQKNLEYSIKTAYAWEKKLSKIMLN